MQVVVIRFTVREDWTGRWLDLVGEFTRATRAEDTNLWFWWARSVDEPNVFFLLEGHREEGVEEHLKSPLIPKIQREWPAALVETPRVLMTTLPGDSWPELALLPVRPGAPRADRRDLRRHPDRERPVHFGQRLPGTR